MLQLALQYIKGYKKKAIMCIMGIAFSVMLMASLIQMSEQIMGQYEASLTSVSSYDFLYHKLELNQMEEIYEKYKDKYTVAEAMWFAQNQEENAANRNEVIGVNGKWDTIFSVELLEGTYPNGKYEICIEEGFALNRGFLVGDNITLELLDSEDRIHEVTFTVSGIISDKSSSGMSGYLFTTTETAKEIISGSDFAQESINNIVYFLVDRFSYNYDEMFKISGEMREKYGAKFFGQHRLSNEKKENIFNDKGAYQQMSMALNVITVVIFLCMTLFIYQNINMNMMDKIKQFGMLRCIGITNKRLQHLLFWEVFIYSVCGLVLGILGGRVLNRLVANFIIEPFLLTEVNTEQKVVVTYIATVLLTFGSVFFAALGTFLRIRKKSPMELVHFVEKVRKMKSKTYSKNIILDIAQKNLSRAKRRSNSLFFTIFLSMTLIIVIGNGINSMDFSLFQGAGSFADIEIFAELASDTPYISQEMLETLQNMEDIGKVYWQRIENGIEVTINGKKEESLQLVVYSDELMEKLKEVNSMDADISTVLVSNDLQVEGKILQCSMKGCEDFEVKVQQVLKPDIKMLLSQSTDATRISYFIISESMAKKLFGGFNAYTDVYLECESTLTLYELQERVAEEDFYYVDLQNIAEQTTQQFFSMVVLCAYVFISVLILAIFIIMNVVKSNFEQRMKEIGMLCCVGGTKKDVAMLLNSEVMILAVKAMLVAYVVATPFSLYFYAIMHDSAGTGWFGYIFGAPLVLLGCFIVSKKGVNDCLKNKTIDLLRYE